MLRLLGGVAVSAAVVVWSAYKYRQLDLLKRLKLQASQQSSPLFKVQSILPEKHGMVKELSGPFNRIRIRYFKVGWIKNCGVLMSFLDPEMSYICEIILLDRLKNQNLKLLVSIRL